MLKSGNAKQRRNTDFESVFPTLPTFKAKARRADLYQVPYSHDILRLEYPTVNNMWFKTLKTGVPIKFSWKQGKRSAIWLGYVSGVSRSTTPSRENEMVITCIGSSFPLKQKVTRTFKNKTVTEVAAIIAKEHRLGFSGEKHRRRFKQLSITGNQSYWEWLSAQAAAIGYALFMEGAVLVFKSIDRVIDAGVSNAALLSMHSKDVPTNELLFDKTLDSFKVLNSDHVESAGELRMEKVVSGVDPVTNRTFTVAESPDATGKTLRVTQKDVLFREQKTKEVVNSVVDAKAVAKAAATLGKFNISASVGCQGDPRIRPFSVVLVSGTGEVTDGYWLAMSVHHLFHRSKDYLIDMTVVTDSVGTNAPSALRSIDAPLVGILNLQESALGDISDTNDTAVSAKLVNRSYLVTQDSLSYSENPVNWEVSYKSVEGCCG